MRSNIFDIVSKAINMENETKRLVYMAEEDKIIRYCNRDNVNLFSFIDKMRFTEWKSRGHFVNLKDYLNALNYDNLKETATFQIDAFLTLIELFYNFWHLAAVVIEDLYFYNPTGNFYHLKNVMEDILQQYNQTTYYDEQNERIYVIEDKPEVTATCEIASPNLSLEIIKYNHRTLKGNIELKKQILVNLGAEIEPQRKYLKTVNDKLEDGIFFLLNNLNIRHNNWQKGDKKYKEYVDKMSDEELEEWYDELYQMMLLAILLIDNKTRIEKIKQLKINIAGENKNGQT